MGEHVPSEVRRDDHVCDLLFRHDIYDLAAGLFTVGTVIHSIEDVAVYINNHPDLCFLSTHSVLNACLA